MDPRSAFAGNKVKMQLPRVVVNGRFLTQAQTGVQRYARETLCALDRLLASREKVLPEGVRVQLAVPRGAVVPSLSSIDVVTLPYFEGHLWEQTSLAWFVRGATLVGFSYSGPVLLRRQLITVHDATVAADPQSFSPRYRLFHNLLLTVLRRRAETVMTVSEFSRREIAHHFGIVRNVVVGREGWEHGVARGDPSSVLQRHGLRSGRYVLLVGSLKHNKNLELLPRALRLLPRFPLTVAIAGAADPKVFKRTGQLSDAIRLLGFVADADLGVLYKHAAWFLLPSLYEGFGLPAIEAMGNGCPVLAAEAGSLPEVCGDAALYFDPRSPRSLAAALQRAVDDPELRPRLVARQQMRLERYTWQQNARILAAEIGRMLGHSGATAGPEAIATPSLGGRAS